jgi:hypothetical protein
MRYPLSLRNVFLKHVGWDKSSSNNLFIFKHSDERFIFYKLLEDMLPERQI